MKKTMLRNYARLLARVGVNIEKGQKVIVQAGLDQPEFVAMLMDECYKAGASAVRVEWSYLPLTKLNVRNMNLKNLQKVEKWEEEKAKWLSEELPCEIYLISDDPDGLKGVNIQKMAKSRQARHKVMKPYLDAMEGKYQWCVAAVPGVAWAKKVFPGMRTSQAVEKLWQAILSTSRVVDGEDPIEAWNRHNAELKERYEKLNEIHPVELRYRASNGTDLRVGMIPQAEFKGGGDYTLTGHYFNANIPSEEIFISPKKGLAEGIVYASMPLSYQGQLIENFSVRFEGGKAVEVHAEKNEELLKQMIAMDEAAGFLGECALVPFDSPIRNAGVMFYETLFDENAACHLALGAGYIDTLKDYGQYTLEECRELGINDSIIHVDFMIGTEDLDIDAVREDGSVVPVFRKGNWAF